MVSFIAIHFAYSKVKSKFLRNESMSKQNNFEMKLQEKAENLKFNFLWNLLHNNSNPYVVNSNSKKKKKKKKKKIKGLVLIKRFTNVFITLFESYFKSYCQA